MGRKYTYLCFVIVHVVSHTAWGQSSPVSPVHNTEGFIDLNAYHDSRNFGVLTINVLAKLPRNFEYFSLSNFQGSSRKDEPMSFYSEQNLRWKRNKHSALDVSSQWVLSGKSHIQKLRLGVRIRFHSMNSLEHLFRKLHLSYSLNFHLIELSNQASFAYATQIEHVYRMNILRGRLYIGGFADQNLVFFPDTIPAIKWVSEHQLGVRLIDQFYLIAEFRINDFLPLNPYGLGYGLEYQIRF